MSKSASRRKSSTQTKNSSSLTAKQLQLTLAIGLVLAVFAAYSQVGHYFFFTYDDPVYVAENQHVRAGLSAENVKWAFTTVVDSNWIPLTLISHMAVCDMFGLNSGAHHWVNVILHALAAVLLFAALGRATGALWPSAFVALIFALHPLHVQSVAWISERKDVLSACFWFLALYGYVRYTERPNARRYCAVLVLFSLGLIAKPMLVTFPFTLLLLDVWPFRRVQFPRTLWEKVPFFVISAASSVLVYFTQRTAGAMQSTPWGERVENALVSYAGYLGQTFWPSGLAVFYPQRTWITAWHAAAALALIAGISTLAILTWRTRPYIAAGWFWYLGTLVPVVGLVQVGVQAHADRYMYIPMVGLSIILAWGAVDVLRKWPEAKPAIVAAGALACLGCFFVTSAEAGYWRNSGTLFRRALSVTQDNYLAHYMLADFLTDASNRDAEAISHFNEALRIQPDSPEAHNGLGVCLMRTGQDAEAAAQFEAALRLDPGLTAAHYNLGLIYQKDPKRLPDAIAQYEASIRRYPEYAEAHKNLGTALLRVGRTPEAIAQFEIALRLKPDPELAQILNTLRSQAH